MGMMGMQGGAGVQVRWAARRTDGHATGGGGGGMVQMGGQGGGVQMMMGGGVDRWASRTNR